MEKGLVSVIIPTYNRANYIDRAIDSVLSQTYKNIELIIVDDNNVGSTGRKEMEHKMQKYENEPKVKYIKHKINKNGAAARNTGIRFAQGEFITFLDDDDFYFPKRIEEIIKKIKNSNYDACYTGTIVTRNKKVLLIKEATKKGNLQLDILKQKSFFSTGSNMFFTANSIKAINGFDETFSRHQDLEFFVRFFEKYEVLPLNKILLCKCLDDCSNRPNIENAIVYREKYLTTFKNIIQRYTKKEMSEIYYANIFDLLKQYSKNNEKQEKSRMAIASLIDKYNIRITIKDQIKLKILLLDRKCNLIEKYKIIKSNKKIVKISEEDYNTIKKYGAII